MQDNFSMHSWQLKTAINELDETEKIKGKDGKGCWKGYRYAGTENGKDKCVPVNEGEIGQSDILARDLFKLQGKISDDLFYKLRKAINSQDPAALAKTKEIMSRIKPEDERIYMGEEKGQCPECGCKMEEQMCNECGYMEEAATFTNKFDDNPELKGGQKDLPDEVQAKIVAKEGHMDQNILTPLQQYLYDYEVEISGEDFANEELKNIKKLNNINDVIKYYGGYRGWEADKDLKYEFAKLIKTLKAKNLKEGEDHEVSMAQNSLESIISSASQLIAKLGDNERDIPGWIQDHITNSENFIDQANQGFHELEPSIKDVDTDIMNESNNPEGDALVLRFLQGIAKKFNYPVSHAAMFVKERISKLGY
jgi:hypothetical protein